MTGFRLDTSRFKTRIARLKGDVQALSFREDIAKFAQDTLQRAVKITPVRSVSLIEKNQRKQFAKRGSYIRQFPESATRAVSQPQFIKERAQARFLYRKSWKQCADSAKLRITVSPEVSRSVTRRRKPVQQPPKGYAQWRGGKQTLSLVIFNPFLEQKSKYKPFTGKQILEKAAAGGRAQFQRDVENRIRRTMYGASR